MSKAAQRAIIEYKAMTGDSPVDGIKVTSDDPTSLWYVTIAGPEGSPFEGGVFYLNCELDNYPFKPPKVVFKSKIYHPNVSEDGTICEQMYI